MWENTLYITKQPMYYVTFYMFCMLVPQREKEKREIQKKILYRGSYY